MTAIFMHSIDVCEDFVFVCCKNEDVYVYGKTHDGYLKNSEYASFNFIHRLLYQNIVRVPHRA